MMNLATIFSCAWSGHCVILILQKFLGTGGARCLSVFDVMVGGGSSSPWIVTGGKGGDVMVHDFRYIATGRGKKPKPASGLDGEPQPTTASSSLFWSLPKAHSGQCCLSRSLPIRGVYSQMTSGLLVKVLLLGFSRSLYFLGLGFPPFSVCWYVVTSGISPTFLAGHLSILFGRSSQ